MDSKDILKAVKDQIPKTPESAYVAMKGTEMEFTDVAIGNMWDRMVGFDNPTVDDLEPFVDSKGGSAKVTERSMFGAIIKIIKSFFSYGTPTQTKDNDDIYNKEYAQEDIPDVSGSSQLQTNNIQGTLLYNRIESIFQYFSKKTKFIFVKIKELYIDLEKIKTDFAAQLNDLDKQFNDNSQQQDQNNQSTNQSLESINKSIDDMKLKISDLEKNLEGFTYQMEVVKARVLALEKKIP